MKDLLGEWKKIGLTLKPDPVKDALSLFMGDFNMAKKSPNVDTYKTMIEARVRATKAGKAVHKDPANKAKLKDNDKAIIFLTQKISSLTGEYQQEIGKKVRHLDQELSDELEKAMAGIDQALSHSLFEHSSATRPISLAR